MEREMAAYPKEGLPILESAATITREIAVLT